MNMLTLLLLGWSGMLGREFQTVSVRDYMILAPSHSELDVRDRWALEAYVDRYRPDIIVNCAACTDVWWMEWGGRLDGYEINVLGAENISCIARTIKSDCIQISTDYVFDGKKWTPYLPTDTPNPINRYGVSKYKAEVVMKDIYPDTIIVRTSALYGGVIYPTWGCKPHFLNKLLEKSFSWEKVSVISDQWSVPTSCLDLSRALKKIISESPRYRWEVLHITNTYDESWVSWYDFAKECSRYFPELEWVLPILSHEYMSQVDRPRNSTLFPNHDFILPFWKDALSFYIQYHK